MNRSFIEILNAISLPQNSFYPTYVQLPKADDPVPPFILNNPKFYPFLKNALGAIDGTHINCNPSASERAGARNRKGALTQNCLAISSFSLHFIYIITGWEGAAADATMYANSRYLDLPIPQGKYYLADAGFGACDGLLVPYRGVRYHLAEWGRASARYVGLIVYIPLF